ncbi:MAG: hypothetical protein PVG49_06935 [Desulfobacteraceae bacterium]|jgi:hypothetical protein
MSQSKIMLESKEKIKRKPYDAGLRPAHIPAKMVAIFNIIFLENANPNEYRKVREEGGKSFEFMAFFEDFPPIIAAITRPSKAAIQAQKTSSRAMRGNGSPNKLKGVKNSQNKNVMTKTRPANFRPCFIVPPENAIKSPRKR